MKTLANRRTTGIAGTVLLLMSLVVALGLPAAGTPGGDPLGNNGTIKVDGVEFDTHPDNEPHVGCLFQVDFYGFDEGVLWADVTFAVQPPTGGFVTILTGTVDIGEDAAGGGTDLDHEETYDLTSVLASYEAHPQQGWHVKLTVNADGSIGADTKHKVFWVTGCETPTTPPGSTAPTTTGSTAPTTTGSTTPTTTGSTAPTTTGSTTPTTTGSTPTTTGLAPTTTGLAPTTTGLAPTTTGSTAPTTTGSTAPTRTASTAPTTTASTAGETSAIQVITASTGAEVDTAVMGIQVSAPEAAQVSSAQVATQVTLPFTGVSTSSIALLAMALAGIGLLLLMASRKEEEGTPVRSWN